MIKKKATKKHAKKKAIKKVSGVHKDNKSHNVKINVLSGTINFETFIDKKFKHIGDINLYKIRIDKYDNKISYFLEKNNEYFANIDKITKNYFTAFNFNFNKLYRYKIYFNKLILI